MLLFVVAKEMHLPPDVVRAMDYEDVVYIATLMSMESERVREASSSHGRSPGQVTRLKKR